MIQELIPSRSPSPIRISKQQIIRDGQINYDISDENSVDLAHVEDDIDINEVAQTMTEDKIKQKTEQIQTKSRAQVLEIINDLPDADIEPPKNILFVCKLHPVTQDHDLELIFSRFGQINACDIIRDWKTGDSLQYAFIEFETEEACV